MTFSFQMMQLESFIKDNGSICLNSLLYVLILCDTIMSFRQNFSCVSMHLPHLWACIDSIDHMRLCYKRCAHEEGVFRSLRLLYAIISQTLSSKHQYSAPPLFCQHYVINVIFCVLFSHLRCYFDVKALVFLLWYWQW